MNASSALAHYTDQEQQQLLTIARVALTAAAQRKPRPKLELATLSSALCEKRAAFVTYHIAEELRGCLGTLTARLPLAEEVNLSASLTATNDTRFMPVTPDEVSHIHIEISVLTPPVALPYAHPQDLATLLRPHVDGLLLEYQGHGATFLPAVWENVRGVEEFLSLLCRKMGVPAETWKQVVMRAQTYQAVKIEE